MNEVTTMTDTRGLETVLLAVGNRDDTRVDALVDAVREVAVPTDATRYVTSSVGAATDSSTSSPH